MTDPVPEPEPRVQDRGTPPSMPRWVKVSAIVVVAVLLVLVVIMALAGGEHGPGLHTADALAGVVASVRPLVAASS